MVSGSHVVVGAAIGASLPRVRYAVPAAFVSHFVLDQIPHSCFNMMSPRGLDGPANVLLLVGMAISIAIIAWAAALAWRLRTRWVVMAAAVAAFLPDPLSHRQPISDWFLLLPGAKWVPWVHYTFHCDVTRTHVALGFATQVIVVALGLWVLARKRRLMNKKPE